MIIRDFLELVAPRVGEAQDSPINGLDSFAYQKAVTQSRASPGQVSSAGFVYFIRAGRTYSVKIGWARDPENRLDQMQVGCPHKLHLIGFAPGSHGDEKEWHHTWPQLRQRGEWFRLDEALRSAINARLHQADATRFIHIKTDWRAVRKGSPSPDILAEIERLRS